MEILMASIVCAARHYIAAHESAVEGKPVAFGEVGRTCQYLNACNADWLKTAAPIFEAAGVFPKILRIHAKKGDHDENER